jgi:hypothetical protein
MLIGEYLQDEPQVNTQSDLFARKRTSLPGRVLHIALLLKVTARLRWRSMLFPLTVMVTMDSSSFRLR